MTTRVGVGTLASPRLEQQVAPILAATITRPHQDSRQGDSP